MFLKFSIHIRIVGLKLKEDLKILFGKIIILKLIKGLIKYLEKIMSFKDFLYRFCQINNSLQIKLKLSFKVLIKNFWKLEKMNYKFISKVL